jgi:hypothetical protein
MTDEVKELNNCMECDEPILADEDDGSGACEERGNQAKEERIVTSWDLADD